MNSDQALAHRFQRAIDALPLIAILRGIRPDEAIELGKALFASGLRILEVPLNSPDPFVSIAALRQSLPDDALIGAGTVLSLEDVGRLRDCGANLVFMPHADVQIVRAAKRAGLLCVPGIATPTEAFAALAAGADALKCFPGEMITAKVFKAIRVVLPPATRMIPFGGITPETMKPYVDAGAAAFGLGSALYKPGMNADELAISAGAFVDAWANCKNQASVG